MNGNSSAVKSGTEKTGLRDESGLIIIEATVSLIFFVFFLVAILSFTRIYSAQRLVSHATIDCAQAMAVECAFRETFANTNTGKLMESSAETIRLFGETASKFSEEAEKYFELDFSLFNNTLSLGSSNINFISATKDRFAYAIADDGEAAEKLLKRYGIQSFDDIDFSESSIDGNDIKVKIKYKVALYIPFAGKNEVELSKTAVSRAFKSINRGE